MAEPKEQQDKDSAVRLAKIIAKLMVEVEKLREDLDKLNVMFNSMSNIVNVMMNDVTNEDTQKKLIEIIHDFNHIQIQLLILYPYKGVPQTVHIY